MNLSRTTFLFEKSIIPCIEHFSKSYLVENNKQKLVVQEFPYSTHLSCLKDENYILQICFKIKVHHKTYITGNVIEDNKRHLNDFKFQKLCMCCQKRQVIRVCVLQMIENKKRENRGEIKKK